MSVPTRKPFRAEQQRAAMSKKTSSPKGPQSSPDTQVFGQIDDMMGAIERLEQRVSLIVESLEQIGNASVAGSAGVTGQPEAAADPSAPCERRDAVLGLRRIQEGGQNIFSAAGELSDVISQTEEAAGEIIDACEVIDQTVIELIEGVQHEVGDERFTDDLNVIRESIMKILQASSFQDLTGQRITRVTRMLSNLEERIVHVEQAMGISSDDIERHNEEMANAAQGGNHNPHDPHFDESNLLNGPSADGDGISQDDIDKLFG